jgi:hypothetical protein
VKSLLAKLYGFSSQDRSRTTSLLVACLAFHLTASLYCNRETSVTVNEPGRLVAGLAYWRWGTTSVYRVNPPLVHAIIGLPVCLAGGRLPEIDSIPVGPGARPEYVLEQDFLDLNRDRFAELLFLARIPCIIISLAGAIICFKWASELYGDGSGLLAAACWCFCPSFVGHAAVVGTDVACATTAVAAAWMFWRWLNSRRFLDAVVCGIALGVAVCTKFTNLGLLAAWCIVGVGVAAYNWRNALCWGRLGRAFAGALLIGAVALLVTNGMYAFSGTFLPLREYRFVSERLNGAAPGGVGNRFKETPLGAIPVPLPRDMILGIDTQLRDLESFHQDSYLCGSWSSEGWRYYYLVASLVKLPVGLLILFAISAMLPCSGFQWRRTSLITCFLAVHALVYFIGASTQVGLNHHYRYVLPFLPFVFIYASSLASDRAGAAIRRAAIVCVFLIVVACVTCLPNALSFFNVACGGPGRGPSYLLHSNIDWGQDLVQLKRFVDRGNQPGRPIKLAYYGPVDPAMYGINYRFEKTDFEAIRAGIPFPGTYAVSVNLLYGAECWFPSSHGRAIRNTRDSMQTFRKLQPIGRAGYSIYIYCITLEDANHVRRELGLPELSEE